MGEVGGPVIRGWEYKKFDKALSSFDEEELNKLGADGWELVASEHMSMGDRGPTRRATVFKRPYLPAGGRATGGGFGRGGGSEDPRPVPGLVPAQPMLTPPPEPPLTMIALKHMRAEDAAKVLSEVFNDATDRRGGVAFAGLPTRPRVKVVAEPSTNTLIVRATADDLKVIQTLVDKLDAAPGKGTR